MLDARHAHSRLTRGIPAAWFCIGVESQDGESQHLAMHVADGVWMLAYRGQRQRGTGAFLTFSPDKSRNPLNPRDRQHQQRRRPAGRAKPHRISGDQAGHDRAHDDRRARLRTRRAAGERDRSRHHGHRHDRASRSHFGKSIEDLDRLTQSGKLSTRMTPRTLIYGAIALVDHRPMQLSASSGQRAP